MTFPIFKDKHLQDSITTPQVWLEYRKRIGRYPQINPPEGIILCYQKSLFEYILENHKTTKVDFGEMHLLDQADDKVAIIGKFGIGAPAAVIWLENLTALGASRFLSIGTAGALQKELEIGDIVVCDRALRDEGTSHHYLQPSKYARASESMTERIKGSLSKFRQKYTTGTSWTIDAPYRESVAEVKMYQMDGVLTVEMEAAALFVVAEYRKVEMGAILTIRDSLAELEWNPQFHHDKTQEGLETIYRVALDVLS